MKYFLTRDFSKTITAVFSAFVFLLFLTTANLSHAALDCAVGQWYHPGFVKAQCFDTQADCAQYSANCQQKVASTQTEQTVPSTGQTQVVSCAGGTGTCMVSGCAATDSKPADPVCGIYDCCVPTSAETTPTCENSGGYCFTSCGTHYHPSDPVLPCNDTTATCCVADTQANQNAANTDNSANNTGNNANQSGSLLGGLVQCGTGEGPDAANQCGFNDIISLIQRVINFLLFVIAMPLAAIAFTWTGFQLMLASSQGKADGLGILKQRMFLIVGGFGLALSAWLIVHAIVAGLGVSETYNFLGS
ncbi:MAG: pilin [Candidatus Parcubacteria bacterium]|nr:pilin [Candidatus Parcubacteria bacterium]